MTAGDIRLLLDPDAMRRRLEAIPVFAEGLGRLASVSFERLWAKPGRHFHVSYRVTVERDDESAEMLASAGLMRPDETAADLFAAALGVPKPTRLAHAGCWWSASLSTAVIETPPALVQLFPWDRRLPTLALAFDPSSLESEASLPSIHACTLAGYWPGIRCNVRYECGAERRVLYGKVLPAGTVTTAAALQTAVSRAVDGVDALSVPRMYGQVSRLNLLLTEPVDGVPLQGGLRRRKDVLARVATALAAFHGVHVPLVERRFGPRDDLAVVEPWVSLVTAVFPPLAGIFEVRLADLQEAAPGDDPRRATLVHRDFYDKQVLVTGARIGLLDLDTVCLGDAEIDVANFCAHLRLRELQKDGSAAAAISLVQHFIAAYVACRTATDPNRVRWYQASALLRLACLYALRPAWHALAPRMLEESRKALYGRDDDV